LITQLIDVEDKEQWELVISHLIANQGKSSTYYRIREAISFEWQSHGDAFIVNAKKLVDVGPGGVSKY
jgi:hypothetical protein